MRRSDLLVYEALNAKNCNAEFLGLKDNIDIDCKENMKNTIVVWFSSGAASAVAAMKTIEQYGSTCNVRIVNNPIARERLNTLPVLIEAGLTKLDCYKILTDARIKPPRTYEMGYPNANCIGCVKSASPTYWNHVRKLHPEIFLQRAEQSRDIGCKLVKVKGKRIYLDELDPNAIGRPMKNLDFECGIFCHTDED